MDTLALTLVAVAVSLVIGIPLGVWSGMSRRFESIITPVLDFMQILPTYTYLLPLDPGLPDRPGDRRDRHRDLRDAAGGPAHRPRHPRGARPARSRRRRAWARPAGRSCSRCCCRWPGGPIVRRHQPDDHGGAGHGHHRRADRRARAWGRSVLQALSSLDVGTACNAGLAIVIMAIILDRVTNAAAVHGQEMRRAEGTTAARLRRPLVIAGAVVTAVLAYASYTYLWAAQFPGDGAHHGVGQAIISGTDLDDELGAAAPLRRDQRHQGRGHAAPAQPAPVAARQLAVLADRPGHHGDRPHPGRGARDGLDRRLPRA